MLCIAWYACEYFPKTFVSKFMKYIGFQFMVYMTLMNVVGEHSISLSKRLLSVQWPRLNSKLWNRNTNPQYFWQGCHCCTVWLCCSLAHMTSPSRPSYHTAPASTTQSTCVGSENLHVGLPGLTVCGKCSALTQWVLMKNKEDGDCQHEAVYPQMLWEGNVYPHRRFS